MTILEAILMGIVQGLTEFLPISSTAHLAIVPAVCGFADPGAGFTAVIQLGTLAAVMWYFRADIVRLLTAWFGGIASGKPFASHDARLGWWIIAATLPIVVFGLLFKDAIKGHLRSLDMIALQLLIGSLLMAVAEWVYARAIKKSLLASPSKNVRAAQVMTPVETVQAANPYAAPQAMILPKECAARTSSLEDLSPVQVLGTGLFQCLALMPGMSRSGSTISGGLLLGMSRETAARFSFLLSLPAISAAGLYSLYSDAIKPLRNGDADGLFATQASIVNLIVATIVSGIVGYAAIAFLMRFLKTRGLWVFIAYRVVLALAIFAWAIIFFALDG